MSKIKNKINATLYAEEKKKLQWRGSLKKDSTVIRRLQALKSGRPFSPKDSVKRASKR